MDRSSAHGAGSERKRKQERLSLRLYIAGESPNSALARVNLQAALAHLGSNEVTLEIIDVLREPSRSLKDRVLVTPTLVKLAPAPVQRVIGNLRDVVVLMTTLGIRPAGAGGAR
jgi:circadian clock protein KaiB